MSIPTLAARVLDSLLPKPLHRNAGRMVAVFSKTLLFCSMTFISMANDSPPSVESRMSRVQSFADLDLVASELAKGPVLPTDPLPKSLNFLPAEEAWLAPGRIDGGLYAWLDVD